MTEARIKVLYDMLASGKTIESYREIGELIELALKGLNWKPSEAGKQCARNGWANAWMSLRN